MKLKVILSNEQIKALDINLHLENPSRKKVSQVLRTINESLMSVLPKDMLKNVTSPISDKTDIIRYDLKGIEKEELLEIKNTIKYSNRDNFFVFLNENDDIIAIVNDYQIIKTFRSDSEDNINILLKKSFYVLNFKIEDIEENVKIPYNRRAAREDSYNVEREEHLRSQQTRLNSLYEEFQNSIKNIIKENQRRIIKNKEITGNIKLTPVMVSELNIGDKFVTGGNDRNPNIFIEVIDIERRENLGPDQYYLEYRPGNSGDNRNTIIEGTSRFYRVDILSKEDDFDTEYEVFMPKNIDWKSLIESGQSFPNTLFPNDISYDTIRSLKEKWDKMVSIVKKEDIDIGKTRAIEIFTERVSKENYRGFSNLTYIDKSGYRVNLSKYFSKLLEVPPKVPKEVIKVYEDGFKFIESESKRLVKLIQKYVSEESWSKVRELSTILEDYGTKEFNDQSEKYLKEENYNKKDESSYSKKEAISNIERFVNFFKDGLQNVE